LAFDDDLHDHETDEDEVDDDDQEAELLVLEQNNYENDNFNEQSIFISQYSFIFFYRID
jgi:hypothetical protein